MTLALAFSLLFATRGGTPPPELDALPPSIRERAAMIFVAKYVTSRGEPVDLGTDQVAFKLLAHFEVKSMIFGNVPEQIEINPAEVPPKSSSIDEPRGGRTYLVVMDLSNEILALVKLSPKAEHVEIADYGRYQRDPDEPRQDAPDTTSGYVNIVAADTEPTLLDRTNVIDATIGTTFGIQFLAEGAADRNDEDDDDDIAPLRVRVLHPPMTDPITKKVTTKEEWDAPANLDIIRFTGWTFENESELVPGRWAIEVLQDGRVMARQEFTIRAVAALPASSSPARTRTPA
jgi:hypothetical protein